MLERRDGDSHFQNLRSAINFSCASVVSLSLTQRNVIIAYQYHQPHCWNRTNRLSHQDWYVSARL